MEHVRKYKDIKLARAERRRTYLVSEPSYHTTKFFTDNLLAIKIKKSQILINNHVYLQLSILDLSKTVIYEFWYDYVEPKYGDNAKHCFMDTDRFIVHVKTGDIYKDIAEDVEKRFGTSNNERDRPLPKGKNKKVIVIKKNELGGQFMKNVLNYEHKHIAI